MDLFKCPTDPTLPEIEKQACNFKVGQVVKIALGLISAGVPFDGAANAITTQAAWNTAVSALDESKIIVTNYLNNLVIPSTDLIEDGGETNINRMPELIDGGNALCTFNPRGIAPAIRAAMKKITQFSMIQPGVTDLGIMLINSDGDVIHDETNYWIPAYNFFLGDSDVVAEKGKSNSSIGKFMLAYGWSDNLKKSTPAFNLLATYPSA